MFKPVALGAAALMLCFFVGPAGAAALASASMNISSFVWYTDSDNFGDHSVADQPVTTALSGSKLNLLRTYFEEKVVAQGYVQLSEDEIVDSAVRASVKSVGFDVAATTKPIGVIPFARSFARSPTEGDIWEPEELDLRVDTLRSGGSDQPKTQGTNYSYSFDSGTPGMLSLVGGQVYEISAQASARDSVNSSSALPAAVPAPPMLWLLAVGLFGLIASRKTFWLYN